MPWSNWIILGIIFSIIEIFTPTFFIILFGIGAFMAGLASYLSGSIAIQWIIFLGVSGFLILFVRKFCVVRLFRKPSIEANVDGYIGKTAIVLNDVIKNTLSGRVKIDGDVWIAITEDDTPIKTGEIAKIIGVSGTKLIIKREEK